MTPELNAAAAIVGIVEKLGGWTIGTVAVCMFVAPISIFLYSVKLLVESINRQTVAVTALQQQVATTEKESQKRAMAFVSKYDNNIEFVKNYERLSSELISLVHVNVQAMTKMVDRVDSNQWCPIVRRKGDPNE